VGESKYPGRFTLQFNLEDPQQRMAAEILGQQGRRKAQFLANAVLQYIRHPDGPDYSTAPIGMDMATLKRMMLEILQNDPQLLSGERIGQVNVQYGSDEPAITRDEPTSDNVLAAMSNTLAAFRDR